MPNPIPVLVLGRLAVDSDFQGQEIGVGMLQDAMRRALQVSVAVGARALAVHAIDDGVVAFYEANGFRAFPAGSRTMFLPIEQIGRAL
jgi:GNAT superfamily N-acetyltransferase